MRFNKTYNRQEFVSFLQNSFLPDDFVPASEQVVFSTKTKYSTKAVKLGRSETLDLVVYEIKHTSKNDARVALSKEAFRILADEMEDRALVIFVPNDNQDNYRFSFIEISLEIKKGASLTKQNYSNPRRYSYLLGKDIAYYIPNKYLNEKGRVVNDEDLRSRFSVEVLTKEFYNELSDWYAWAIKIIRFPNDINDDADDAKYNNESAIRLITRLIFVWFLKQRHLVPNEFFDEKYIAENLIKDFDPHKTDGLFEHKSLESKYYKAILQNLFFAMLNNPITAEGSIELSERRFRNSRGDYDNNKLMRYEDYFTNPQLFVDLANNTVPFLNGGLFDCLDDKDNGMYYDGFSDRELVKKSLVLPDYLFFGDGSNRTVDLSEWYGDKKKKKVPARGIIDILRRYNFTVEENTPFDKEVSLDPELLGKVFENLLASFNPETQTTARKQTGSFYTPRDIVQYMVDESLVAHLKRSVGEELEPQYRQLMEYSDDAVELTSEQRKQIMQSLYACKILDPACGSGAFPMGILQQMVHILGRIDPENKQWKDMMMNLAIDETTEAFKNASSEERSQQIKDIERSFDEGVNRPDFARKLYLIENCIYGVDIQPIAIQISKLRFFISLIVDQKTNTTPADNFGVRPLPNLEAKFVAANTLIGLESELSLADSAEVIVNLKKRLRTANHKIFSAKTVKTKRKYKQQVVELRQAIATSLHEMGFINNSETKQLASWDMFDQNASSSFFDPEWMFGVNGGFDVVIGNPPYVLLQNTDILENTKKVLLSSYFVAQYKVDLYHLFYEKGLNVLKNGGVLNFITPISFLKNIHNNKLRQKLVLDSTIQTIVRFFIPVFDAAVDNAILICLKGLNKNNTVKYYDIKNNIQEITNSIVFGVYDQCLSIAPDYYLALDTNTDNGILSKLENKYRLNDFAKSYFGIQTFDRNKFVSNVKINDNYRPVIDGTNIKPYKLTTSSEYVNFIPEAIKSGGNPNVYSCDRIVVRQIGESPKGCICLSGIFTLNTVYNLYLWNNKLSLEYLLGLINSKLLSYYWKLTYSDSKKTFPKIKKKPLDSIPIAYSQRKEEVDNITSLVKCILTAKYNDPNIDTTAEEEEIDRIVYKLYDLTYDEILLVDPETPITREEYE